MKAEKIGRLFDKLQDKLIKSNAAKEDEWVKFEDAVKDPLFIPILSSINEVIEESRQELLREIIGEINENILQLEGLLDKIKDPDEHRYYTGKFQSYQSIKNILNQKLKEDGK